MRTFFLTGLLVLLAASAGAQTATAKLYTKSADGKVLVAIQVTPEPGAWVYDDDPDSGGQPTVVTLGPETVEWSQPHFPEPTVKDEPGVGRSKVHKQKFVIYAVGTGEGADPAEVTVALKGLACNERLCLPWSIERVENRGAGADTVWEGFPAALLLEAPAPAAAVAPPAAVVAADEWRPDLMGKDKVAARAFARVEGETVTVVVELAIAPKYHIYSGPLQSDVGPGIGSPTVPRIEGGNVEWGSWTFPEPHGYDPGFGGLTYVHEGRTVLRVTGEAFDEFDAGAVEVSIAGQFCDDRACLMFELTPALSEGRGPDALFAPPAQEDPDAGTTDAVALTAVPLDGSEAPKEEQGLWQFLLVAVGAGLITLLMPCTYPMIPITISFFTKQATARGGNVLGLALMYGLGIVAIFVVIGLVIGQPIVQFAQDWPLNLVIGVLFVVFALSLFGMINLQPPAFLMNVAGKASQKGGYAGVFLMGACLVITSFTCTAPFVGTLLGAGAASGDVSNAKIALGMAVFGLTMATPFVFLALVPGKINALPQAGGWMETLKVFMGFVELAAALKFFSNADIVLNQGNYLEHGGWFSREFCLITWAVIFAIAAQYLFGRINLKSENPDGSIGPGRLLAGTGSALFAAFCLLGVFGYQYGPIMTALAPKPSYTPGLIPIFQGGGSTDDRERLITVEDDYDAALGVASDKNRLLLANFTGHS
jgi:cytochrome c biogenesis protein CcdA